MPTLLIVEDPSAWRMPISGVSLVAAKDYLGDSQYTELKRAKVYNLCRNYAYQSTGYYVSLLATARGHKPMPSITTIQDLRSAPILRVVSEELQHLIDQSLASLRSDTFELSVYWGRNLAARYDRLCQALFNHFPAPWLRVEFERFSPSERLDTLAAQRPKPWRLKRVSIIAWQDIPASHEAFVVEQAMRFFSKPVIGPRAKYRYDLAILVNPEERYKPSNPKALAKFERCGKRLGVRCTTLSRADYGHVAEFDGLFIRETTAVNHHTYRFAQRAQAEGLVVIDDPESIVRCSNKVYLAELFRKQGIAIPKTRIIMRDGLSGLGDELGFPVVLKQPDSSFSRGVVKAKDPAELKTLLDELFKQSELLVAQEYLPSEFDWRIGVIAGQPLFACKYYMAKGHWQIERSEGNERHYGNVETLPLYQVPRAAIDLALAAARAIGDGLYGVDIKQNGDRFSVIEVNDNPNIDSGFEDAVGKDEIYLTVIRTFIERIERRTARAWNAA